MFHNIKPVMRDRMRWLEMENSRDRQDGTPRGQRLRQIPDETGRFLAILAAGATDGDIIEIGTSAGYSTLWLVLACKESGRKVTTFEIQNDKVQLARETFRLAEVTDKINLYHGDALQLLKDHDNIAFCFLDSEKEDYQRLYDIVVPRLVPGGLLVADNVISHAETLGAVVSKANADERVDSVVVPIGKGELLCRRVP
ncbi:MAG TPA: O-methyltransferase [Acidobacteriota bacterium]|nr:O-methyltransferase [Acidobacteriota bacterium]